MHVHQSLAKGGTNLFAGDLYGGLSQTALYYIGGIFKHARAINAFANSTTNSYKRLVPGFEAPVMLAYSARNRSASCRIPFVPSPKARRIEVRFPDPMNSGYLTFAALMMAGLDGILNKIDPGAPADKDLYDLPPEEEKNIPTVCHSLDQALDALDKDRAFLKAGGVFSDDFIDAYRLKMGEVSRFRATHPSNTRCITRSNRSISRRTGRRARLPEYPNFETRVQEQTQAEQEKRFYQRLPGGQGLWTGIAAGPAVPRVQLTGPAPYYFPRRQRRYEVMKRTAFRVALSATLIALPCVASAEDAAAPAPSPWVGSATLASEYIVRGLTQTNEDPTLQAGLEYDDASGLYAGLWGSNISWLSDYSTSAAPVSSSLELDFYLGYRGKFSDDLGYDVGIYTYYYPGTYPHGFVSANTTEIYGALSYKCVSLKYSHSLTNAFGFGDTKNSNYLDLSANYEFYPTWLVNAHVGHQKIDGFGAASYTDYKLGIAKTFDKGFSVALAWYDTNSDSAVYTNAFGHDIGRSTGVLSISKAL